MTYREICRMLGNAGIDTPEEEGALLIEKFCGADKAQLLADRDRDFDSVPLLNALRKRMSRYPLQYILGEWGFYDSMLDVRSGVLIPRADTELIVEKAAGMLKKGARFADIGCGSGCIGVTVLSLRSDTVCVAADKSEDALSLSRENAAKIGVSGRISFVRGDMKENNFWDRIARDGKFDALISNPPYIPSEEIKALAPELAYEPVSALDGGHDGLDFYRIIVKNAEKVLKSGGFLLFECGAGQSERITEIGREYGCRGETYYDIENRDRAVMLEKQ